MLAGGAPPGGYPLSAPAAAVTASAPPLSREQSKHMLNYGTRKPLRKDASWFALMAALGYLAAVTYYLYIRIAFTLDMKDRW